MRPLPSQELRTEMEELFFLALFRNSLKRQKIKTDRAGINRIKAAAPGTSALKFRPEVPLVNPKNKNWSK